MKTREEKVTIVGCGIAGMSCSLYLQRAGIHPLVLGDVGLSSLVNSPEVKNYPGIINTSGVDLLFSMKTQIESLGNVDFLEEDCEKLQFLDSSEKPKFKLNTKEHEIITENVVIASGRRPRLLGIPDEKLFLGNGISTCAYCDGNLYEGKKVAVVGGGNSAVEEAMYLSKIVDHVDVIVRKDHLRSELPQSILESLRNVSIKLSTEIYRIFESSGRLKVMLSTNEYEEYDGIFYAIGQIPNTQFLPDYLRNENGYVISHGDHFLAAGDVDEYTEKQAIVAAADGASKALWLINHAF